MPSAEIQRSMIIPVLDLSPHSPFNIHTLLADLHDISGEVNATGPEPVTNATFTETLARVVQRPALFPVPAMALKLVFGEMAQATLLASQRVVPRRLLAAGYVFRHSTLEPALRAAVTE